MLLTIVKLLGIAVAVLSLYQVKLLPETYPQVVALWSSSHNKTLNVTIRSVESITAPLIDDVTFRTKRSDAPDETTLRPTNSVTITTVTSTSSSKVTDKSVSVTQKLMEHEAISQAPPTEETWSQTHVDLGTSSDLLINEPTPSSANTVSLVSASETTSVTSLAVNPSTLSHFQDLIEILEDKLAFGKRSEAEPSADDSSATRWQQLIVNVNLQTISENQATGNIPGTLPAYFEDIFNLVQTSLYVSIGAGLIIFMSALLGICGGLCRVPVCLKLGVCGVILVMVLEMATAAFIFVSHDKVRNRNKHKDFDAILTNLCDLANFCINPMMLVLLGSFLCIAVVFQIGSVTLSCKLISDQVDEYAFGGPDGGMGLKMHKHGKRHGRHFFEMMAGPGMPPGPCMPMFPPNWGGYPPYPGPLMNFAGPYPPMPMQNFGTYPQQQGPFGFQPVAGSRPTVNLAFVS